MNFSVIFSVIVLFAVTSFGARAFWGYFWGVTELLRKEKELSFFSAGIGGDMTGILMILSSVCLHYIAYFYNDEQYIVFYQLCSFIVSVPLCWLGDNFLSYGVRRLKDEALANAKAKEKALRDAWLATPEGQEATRKAAEKAEATKRARLFYRQDPDLESHCPWESGEGA